MFEKRAKNQFPHPFLFNHETMTLKLIYKRRISCELEKTKNYIYRESHHTSTTTSKATLPL